MICFVITARTSLTKMFPIIQETVNSGQKVICIATASAVSNKFGSILETLKMIKGLTIKKLNTLSDSDNSISMIHTLNMTSQACAQVFEEFNPSCVVVMADRHEVLGPAISASYLNIPLVHIQGGELSGNIDNKVRYAISSLADLHFPATEKSYKNLINMGIKPTQIILSGCPSIDLAKKSIQKIDLDHQQSIIDKYGVGAKINIKEEYIIVMQHPVTNEIKKAKEQILITLKAIVSNNIKAIWFWPNSDAGTDQISKEIRRARESSKANKIRFVRNLDPSIFLPLLYNSIGIVGNSSVAIRECSYLGVPAINIGTRQSNRERGDNVVDCNHNIHEIERYLSSHFNQKVKRSELYGKGESAVIISNKIIECYGNDK